MPADTAPESPPPPPARETIQAVVSLLVLLGAFFARPLVTGRVLLPANDVFDVDPLWQTLASSDDRHTNPALGDQVYQFLPWTAFARRELRQGRLPLWNPYSSGGHPLLGNGLSGVFSPFNALAYLLPLYSSYLVIAILKLFVAGLFTYLFARELGMRHWGALLAMICFTFSGPLIGWLGFPPASVVVWLPAMLLATRRAVARANLPYAILCGITIGLQFLGGQPESSFHATLIWAAYALFCTLAVRPRNPRRLLRPVGMLGVAGIVGLGLGMVQIAPFLEALAHSATLTARQQATAAGGVLGLWERVWADWHEWPTLVTALLPLYFGTPLDNSYWLPFSNYVEQSFYVGVLPLALAPLAVFDRDRPDKARQRQQTWFWLGLALFCVGAAARLPGTNAVNLLPLFRIAKNGRLRLIYAFAVAILSGQGLDRLLRGRGPAFAQVTRTLTGLALVGLVLSLGAYTGFTLFKGRVIASGRAFMDAQWGTPLFSRPIEHYYTLVQERYEAKLELYAPFNLPMYLPVAVALVWAAARASQLGQVRPNALAWLALGLLTLDLFSTSIRFNPTTSRDQILPTPPAVAFLQQQPGVFRVVGTNTTLNPNISMLFDLADARGYDAMIVGRYSELLDRLDGHYRIHFHSLFTHLDAPLLDLLNVRYALSEQELGGRWEPVYRDAGPVSVYRNKDALPRAFVVYQIQIASDPRRSLELITSPGFVFRRAAVLEQVPPGWEEPSEVTSPGQARILRYAPAEVEIEVNTQQNGLLVLTDAYMPGWRATIDETSCAVYVADHAFRAIAVPKGRHRVTFTYRPSGFALGAATTLATVAALLVLGVATITARIRGRSH